MCLCVFVCLSDCFCHLIITDVCPFSRSCKLDCFHFSIEKGLPLLLSYTSTDVLFPQTSSPHSHARSLGLAVIHAHEDPKSARGGHQTLHPCQHGPARRDLDVQRRVRWGTSIRGKERRGGGGTRSARDSADKPRSAGGQRGAGDTKARDLQPAGVESESDGACCSGVKSSERDAGIYLGLKAVVFTLRKKCCSCYHEFFL